MEVKQFVDAVNKLRLANRGKWYWFSDTVGGKVVRIKAFGTWMQIYDVAMLREQVQRNGE